MKFILGLKLEMSQVFNEKGDRIPVTLVEAGPCEVTQVKTKEGKDKYNSVQIGFKKLKENKIKRTNKSKPYKYLREFKNSDINNFKKGDKIDVSIFEEGDKIKVSGMSKGKGFQGGVKRHGFSGRPATHGTKHEQRTIGSVGSAFPQRVIKGRKMPGRMGYERITIKNLEIIKVDKENNILAIKGAIPGSRKTLLEIKE